MVGKCSCFDLLHQDVRLDVPCYVCYNRNVLKTLRKKQKQEHNCY